jgi:3-methyl-2-oxobutanoate hydroxymethyltransferase
VSQVKKVTSATVRERKGGEKLTMLTAYDYPMARLLDGVGVDILLVGDSSGTVIAGYENTLPVTLEQTIYHTAAVVRGTSRALVVADLPFLSYQVSLEDARRNAGRVMKETNCGAVKLEGGVSMKEVIATLVNMDIPVMGHVGLTPQSVHRMGGFKVQGSTKSQAEQILADALAVEEAGAFSLVMEGVPQDLARQITETVSIPTIGIGAGAHCDGQVLVIHDLLGLFDRFRPKFVKQYVNLSPIIQEAVGRYVSEVKDGTFPGAEHSFGK